MEARAARDRRRYKFLVCKDRSTKWLTNGSLNELGVNCDAREFLQGFTVQRMLNKMRYKYRCCGLPWIYSLPWGLFQETFWKGRRCNWCSSYCCIVVERFSRNGWRWLKVPGGTSMGMWRGFKHSMFLETRKHATFRAFLDPKNILVASC